MILGRFLPKVPNTPNEWECRPSLRCNPLKRVLSRTMGRALKGRKRRTMRLI